MGVMIIQRYIINLNSSRMILPFFAFNKICSIKNECCKILKKYIVSAL